MKKNIKILIILSSIFFITACEKTVEMNNETESLNSYNTGIVSSEKVIKPTINIDDIVTRIKIISTLSEATESEIVSTTSTLRTDMKALLKELEKVDLKKMREITLASESIAKQEMQNTMDQIFDVDDKVYHGTEKIDTTDWKYGMTPCEWVYIEPGIQLISNYKPNSSRNYAANGKVRVSSGLKGCYIPIFIKTDMMTNAYDGRMYVFEDYTKSLPENMLFDNSLRTVKYKNMSVEEILRMGFDITRLDNGVLKIGDTYINIIYVTDLDKILNGN